MALSMGLLQAKTLAAPCSSGAVRRPAATQPARLAAQTPLLARTRALAKTRGLVAARAVDAAAAAEGWWMKELPANLVHINTVQQLVDELAEGSKQDRLVVVDFFAPWCRACKALFPKFKKLCAENPDVTFLAINFDENKGLARGLGVKVLPYFHLYRGPEGRVAEFSASVSKVQRLRDAIASGKSDRCYLQEAPMSPLAEFPSVLPGGSLGVTRPAVAEEGAAAAPELVA